MKKMKLVLCYMIALVMTFTSLSMNIYASTDYQRATIPPEYHLDNFLRSADFPESVIREMTFGQKFTIYQALYDSTNLEFISYTQRYVSLGVDGIAPRIPTNELSLRVASILQLVNVNGVFERQYMIFPSFVWNINTDIQNDRFSFTLDSNQWRVVAGDQQLRLWGIGSFPGTDQSRLIDRPHGATFAGHHYNFAGMRFPDLWGGFYRYEGHAIFRAIPTVDNPRFDIILAYAQDNTPLTNASISLNLIPPFSMSFSSNNNRVRTTAQHIIWR